MLVRCAFGIYPQKFENTLSFNYKARLNSLGKREWWMPEDQMNANAKECYYAKLQCFGDRDPASTIDDILGASADDSQSQLETEIMQARLENLKTRTTFITEQLEQKKEKLFSEWSEKFYFVFSESFAKVKNRLIDLHLTKDQLDLLNSAIDDAITSMGDKLITIKSDTLTDGEDDS